MSDINLSPELLALDIETSGLEPDKHAILSIGLEHVQTGKIWSADVRHKDLCVSPAAMRVNKIPIETLDDPNRKALGQVDFELTQWLLDLKTDWTGRFIAVGYNVGSFDLQFINRHMPKTAQQLSYRTIDLNSTCFMADLKDRRNLGPSIELGTTKTLLRVMNPNSNAHTALADAQMAAQDLRLLITNTR